MMIFGFPGETRQTLKETLAFLLDECRVLSYRNVEICPQLYLPLVGTRAFEQTNEFGMRFGYKPNTWRVVEQGWFGVDSRACVPVTLSRWILVCSSYKRSPPTSEVRQWRQCPDQEPAMGNATGRVRDTVIAQNSNGASYAADLLRILDEGNATI